jgi:hypothetical protein
MGFACVVKDALDDDERHTGPVQDPHHALARGKTPTHRVLSLIGARRGRKETLPPAAADKTNNCVHSATQADMHRLHALIISIIFDIHYFLLYEHLSPKGKSHLWLLEKKKMNQSARDNDEERLLEDPNLD